MSISVVVGDVMKEETTPPLFPVTVPVSRMVSSYAVKAPPAGLEDFGVIGVITFGHLGVGFRPSTRGPA